MQISSALYYHSICVTHLVRCEIRNCRHSVSKCRDTAVCAMGTSECCRKSKIFEMNIESNKRNTHTPEFVQFIHIFVIEKSHKERQDIPDHVDVIEYSIRAYWLSYHVRFEPNSSVENPLLRFSYCQFFDGM